MTDVSKALADLAEVCKVSEGAKAVYHSALASRDSQIAEAYRAGVPKQAIRQVTGLSAGWVNEILAREAAE